jgi:hypothetical protein
LLRKVGWGTPIRWVGFSYADEKGSFIFIKSVIVMHWIFEIEKLGFIYG